MALSRAQHISSPRLIEDEERLVDLLTQPSPELITFIRNVRSPLVLLGAGGKMGPTLAVLAARAATAAGHDLKVIAVSRFADKAARNWLESNGISTIECDLFNRESVAGLPDAGDIIFLAGVKFGTAERPALTWAANTIIPGNILERFPNTRCVALSTGNVYPYVAVDSGGATEDCQLTPTGEYANAAVARERLFQYFAHRLGTPVVLLRLNYAVELRYGVLHDIARSVAAGAPVDVSAGWFNCIWQRDANDAVIRSLQLAANPPAVVNLSGPEILKVSDIASRLGSCMGVDVQLQGTDPSSALISNCARFVELLGPPMTPLDQVITWTADWVKRGQRSLNKRTHYEVRDGKY